MKNLLTLLFLFCCIGAMPCHSEAKDTIGKSMLGTSKINLLNVNTATQETVEEKEEAKPVEIINTKKDRNPPAEAYDINKHKSPFIVREKTLKVMDALRPKKLIDIHTNEINPVVVPTKNQIDTERFMLKRRNFSSMMNREYIKLADRLFLHHNYSDATLFRRKGIKASGMKDILPEDPKKWEIKEDVEMDDLLKARIGLLESLSQNAVYVTPNAAAKAVVFYDCWVSQAKHKWIDDRTDCKMAFNDVYGYLRGIYEETKMKGLADVISGYSFTDVEEDYRPYKNFNEEEEYVGDYSTELKKVVQQTFEDDKKKAEEAAKEAENQKATGGGDFIYAKSKSGTDLMYLAYFDQKSIALGTKAKAELDKAAEEIKKANPPSVTINGHTDKSIGADEAMVLSKKRADAARDYLVTKGLNRNLFRTYGFGRNDNLVPNEEGKEVVANRRVEIIFKGAKK